MKLFLSPTGTASTQRGSLLRQDGKISLGEGNVQ